MSRLTQGLAIFYLYGTITLYGQPFQIILIIYASHWPGPLSLVTTNGVSFDVLSTSYLDISVRWVCLPQLCIHCKIPLKRWVSPFRNLRINNLSLLPGAYRRVSRLSSPSSAKASTKCSFYIY